MGVDYSARLGHNGCLINADVQSMIDNIVLSPFEDNKVLLEKVKKLLDENNFNFNETTIIKSNLKKEPEKFNFF
jgi:hypothetical protein